MVADNSFKADYRADDAHTVVSNETRIEVNTSNESVNQNVVMNNGIFERKEDINEKYNTIETSNSSGFSSKDEKYLASENIDEIPSDGEKTSTSRIIRETEIMKSVYDKWYYHVILLFSAFVCGYGYGLDGNIRYIYTGYATSSYAEHSLLSTINVINAVASAASQIVYARASDVFGRLSLFIVSVVFYAVGTIIQCQAYDVQRYCAGSFFYNIGYVGVILVLLLILSDFSSLKWRLFYQFAPTWPYIINTWISGNITSAANPLKHWSWDIGMWAFIFPLSSIPIILCLIHMRWMASKTKEWKLLKQEKSYIQQHTFVSAITDLFWRLDVIGVLLMGASLGCILVPLTLAGGTSSKWNHGNIIAPFALGFVLIPIFTFWEWKFSKSPLIPSKLVKDRAVWSSMAISFLIDFIFYMAVDYLYTVLIVGVNESVKSATRISSLSSFVSTVGSPIFALLITRFTRLKPFIVAGCALWMLSMGLLYHYRGGASSHNGIIASLCVWGVGTTLFTYPINVSVQAAVSHADMATVTALNYTMYRIGSAVGAAVSGAIWTQTLYKQLHKRMGDATLATAAYSSPYSFIVNYTWGTTVRDQMVEAYRYVQRLETIVALVFTVPLLLFSLTLRDARLTDNVASDDIEEGQHINKTDSDPIADFLSKPFKGLFKKNKIDEN
ncbi:hypothetical protein TBLA_0C01040 [Henningerozyma blattae CBS 6284]|uniref:Major facilitator superfamily (MFS) profile domain-containing protein n=1 Tax=Henningerozyma blattae (strain ATCC 34711 / CBS 6284 / DSM 70876 / NBRC 10599 / NRRL Y-10934 / UCD 77-7) TaxID=1071380 RepID=I2H0L7_HENB6|nr:hypothetical protein TBLA_0C01040 [Tetrapisispora blattae CBS 6284]CCH59919.1 hypothetical protein TBLA_0C01040 [Tetrapisispora blattae CBS 6284]